MLQREAPHRGKSDQGSVCLRRPQSRTGKIKEPGTVFPGTGEPGYGKGICSNLWNCHQSDGKDDPYPGQRGADRRGVSETSGSGAD